MGQVMCCAGRTDDLPGATPRDVGKKFVPVATVTLAQPQVDAGESDWCDTARTRRSPTLLWEDLERIAWPHGIGERQLSEARLVLRRTPEGELLLSRLDPASDTLALEGHLTAPSDVQAGSACSLGSAGSGFFEEPSTTCLLVERNGDGELLVSQEASAEKTLSDDNPSTARIMGPRFEGMVQWEDCCSSVESTREAAEDPELLPPTEDGKTAEASPCNRGMAKHFSLVPDIEQFSLVPTANVFKLSPRAVTPRLVVGSRVRAVSVP